MNPRTAIVVLHYANDELTNQCLDSIRENTEYGTYHIVLVDNNSPVPYKPQSPRLNNISYVTNSSHYNVHGINAGLYYALHNLHFKPDFVVNFDNDIICLQNWLPPLVKSMDENPRIGVSGGKQWDKEQKVYRCVGADMCGFLYNNYPEQDANVIWIQGSFNMYRVKMMEFIGLHDFRYKIICSDSDYCIHAADRGWIVRFVADSNVIHLSNTSYGIGKPVETDKEDRQAFIQKWFGLKFAALAKEFPYDRSENILLKNEFTIEKSLHS